MKMQYYFSETKKTEVLSDYYCTVYAFSYDINKSIKIGWLTGKTVEELEKKKQEYQVPEPKKITKFMVEINEDCYEYDNRVSGFLYQNNWNVLERKMFDSYTKAKEFYDSYKLDYTKNGKYLSLENKVLYGFNDNDDINEIDAECEIESNYFDKEIIEKELEESIFEDFN